MNSQRGRNSGLTGIIDISGAPAFTADVWAFKQDFTSQTDPRAGRGDSDWAGAASRAFSPGCTLAISARCVLKGYPVPATWTGDDTGTITLQFHTGATQVLSVRVMQATVKMAAEGEGWDISFACMVLASPTLSGFGGTAAPGATPTPSDKELWAGLTKTYDPNNLQTAATAQYSVWPISDNDAAENARVAALVGALVARFTGSKVKTASLAPGRTSDSGVVTVQFSLTDTVEDVVNPITQSTYDPLNLTSNATSAAVNGPPSHPGGYFVERDGTARELHDRALLSTKNWGLRTTQDDVEMPGSVRDPDPQALVSEERVTKVTDSETPPPTPTPATAGLVLRARQTEQLNRVPRWRHTWVFGPRDSKEDIEFPGSPRETEPSGLTDTEDVTKVTDTEAPPATPTPNNAALKLRRVTSTRQTDAGKWSHAFHFARRNAQNDVEMDGSQNAEDPADLFPTAEITIVSGTVASGSAPTAPSNTKLRGIVTKQQHDTKWSHTFQYAATNTIDDQVFPNSPLDDDPQNLDDAQIVAGVQGSGAVSWPTTPTGLKQRKATVLQLTDTAWLGRYHFARRDTKDDIEMPETFRRLDPLAIDSEAATTEVYDTASPPSDPAAPSAELQLVGRRYETLNNLRSKRSTIFDVTTSEQKRTFPQTKTTIDPNELRSGHMEAAVYAGTPPSDPTAPAGQKLVEKFDVPVTGTKSLRVWVFGKKDSVDDVEFEYEKVITDPQSLESAQVIATVYAVGSTPSDPGASGLQLRFRHDHPLTPAFTTPSAVAAKFVRVWYYELNTTADDVTQPATVTRLDPAKLDDHDAFAELTTSATPNATPSSARSAKLPHVATESVQVKTGWWRHTYHFGRLTNQQRVEFEGSSIEFDPKSLGDETRVTQVATTSTPLTGSPLAAITPSGLKHRRTASVQLTAATTGTVEPAEWRHTYTFARNDAEDDVLQPLNVTDADPQGLDSRQQKATLDGSTPALDAGYKVRDTSTRTLVTGKTLTTVRGALTDAKDDVELPGTTARYSPTDQNQNLTTAVIDDSSSTVLALATAYGESRKADATFDWVEVVRLNANKVRRTIRETSAFELIDAVSFGGKRAVYAIAGAGVLVWLAKKLKRGTSNGTTLWTVLIQPLSIHVGEIEFTLRRRVIMKAGDTLPFMDPSFVGRSNAGNFLGLPAFTTAFLGANPITNVKVLPPRQVELALKFRFSSIGIFDDTGIIPGWSTDTYNVANDATNRWTQAGHFNWPAQPALPLDFDIFLPT